MRAHRITATVPLNKTLTLDGLPFPTGQSVEIIVLPAPVSKADDEKYPLRGLPLIYDRPTDPVAETDWEAAS